MQGFNDAMHRAEPVEERDQKASCPGEGTPLLAVELLVTSYVVRSHRVDGYKVETRWSVLQFPAFPKLRLPLPVLLDMLGFVGRACGAPT